MLSSISKQIQRATPNQGILKLRNRTRQASKIGYLVKAVSNGFEYAGVGDTPIGVVTEVVLKNEVCEIQTTGEAIVFLHKYASTDVTIRSIVASDRAGAGVATVIGSETTYTSIGRTLSSGKGWVNVSLQIIPASTGSSSGLPVGGDADDVLTKDSGADFDASWQPASSSNVTKVGTPVNDQIGVWTGDGPLEGDPDLTFDTSLNALKIGEDSPAAYVYMYSNGWSGIFRYNWTNTAAYGPRYIQYRYGGTKASPATAPTSAFLEEKLFYVNDGTSNVLGAHKTVEVDGVIATGDFDTKHTWSIKIGAAASAEKMVLGSAGLEVDSAIAATGEITAYAT